MRTTPPVYGWCKERLFRSEVMWCVALESRTHSCWAEVRAMLALGFQADCGYCGVGRRGGCVDCWYCCSWVQRLAEWPWTPHIWHLPRYGLKVLCWLLLGAWVQFWWKLLFEALFQFWWGRLVCFWAGRVLLTYFAEIGVIVAGVEMRSLAS